MSACWKSDWKAFKKKMTVKPQVFLTDCESETACLAQALASHLTGNEVIALSGELGAGKTTFIRALARALGIQETVRSPSYALILEYALPGGGHFFHADLYRLENSDQAIGIGLQELMGEGILAIEWSERALELLPENHIAIRLETNPDESRVITICAPYSIRQVTMPDSTLG